IAMEEAEKTDGKPDDISLKEVEKADGKPHDKQDKKSIFFGRFNRKDDKPNLPNFAVLAVIDEGTGIPVEKRTDIFSPFVRLKQEKKGSGLGLSLVAQIVETHGGHISTDTWQGKTRFLVVLPIKKTPKDSDAKEE
ncbi:MAG: HAMP domain-containing sensor histidine kinase, partial [Moraxella sp.]|nr:HAMP domain-containing sensor histidine kinase [Moraxella sp.]